MSRKLVDLSNAFNSAHRQSVELENQAKRASAAAEEARKASADAFEARREAHDALINFLSTVRPPLNYVE